MKDRLTNLGISRDIGVVYFNVLSPKAIDMFNADVVGVTWPRFFKN